MKDMQFNSQYIDTIEPTTWNAFHKLQCNNNQSYKGLNKTSRRLKISSKLQCY